MSDLRKNSLLFGSAVFATSLLTLVLASTLSGQGDGAVSAALIQAAMVTIVATTIFALFSRRQHRGDEAVQSIPEKENDDANSTELDVVTQLPNRHGLTVKLLELMALGERYGNELAVAVIGIDHLDDVDQKYGGAAADKALVAISMELSDTLRMPDRLGRWNEGQFIVVLPETSLQGARNIAERLREAVARAQFEAKRGVVLRLTASIGVTAFRLGDDLESLLSRASRAVDAAKTQGSNRVSTHLAA